MRVKGTGLKDEYLAEMCKAHRLLYHTTLGSRVIKTPRGERLALLRVHPVAQCRVRRVRAVACLWGSGLRFRG